MRHELLLLPSISDEVYLACAQFSLILRTAKVVASTPVFLMHTVSECGSGWSHQKANGTLIKDRAGAPSRSLLRSFSVQRFVPWLEALPSQRKEDLGTSRQEKKSQNMKSQWVYIPHGYTRGGGPSLIFSEEDAIEDRGGVSG